MQDKPTNEQIEASIRAAAAEDFTSRAAMLVAAVDKRRANGELVEFRLDPSNKRFYAVVLEKIAVDLGEVSEAADETAPA